MQLFGTDPMEMAAAGEMAEDAGEAIKETVEEALEDTPEEAAELVEKSGGGSG